MSGNEIALTSNDDAQTIAVTEMTEIPTSKAASNSTNRLQTVTLPHRLWRSLSARLQKCMSFIYF